MLKNTIAMLQNTPMTDRGINCGFVRISQKVNNSRLYGCYQMNHIQQKLFEVNRIKKFTSQF